MILKASIELSVPLIVNAEVVVVVPVPKKLENYLILNIKTFSFVLNGIMFLNTLKEHYNLGRLVYTCADQYWIHKSGEELICKES